jgi:hypothetical protein
MSLLSLYTAMYDKGIHTHCGQQVKKNHVHKCYGNDNKRDILCNAIQEVGNVIFMVPRTTVHICIIVITVSICITVIIFQQRVKILCCLPYVYTLEFLCAGFRALFRPANKFM